MIRASKTTFDAGDGRPKRDLRSREGRASAIMDTVIHGDCELGWRCRYLVTLVAHMALQGYPMDDHAAAGIARYSVRTYRKHLAAIRAAVGEDPVPFVAAVVDGQRGVTEWVDALRRNGGLRG